MCWAPLPGGGAVRGEAGETIRQVGALCTLGHWSCFWVTRPTNLSGHVGYARQVSDPNVWSVTPNRTAIASGSPEARPQNRFSTPLSNP